MKFQVLSIDAWGNQEDGYDWNDWNEVGYIDISLKDTHQEIIQKMYVNGFISNTTGGEVEDDGHNWVIVDKSTRAPVYAIEYGTILN